MNRWDAAARLRLAMERGADGVFEMLQAAARRDTAAPALLSPGRAALSWGGLLEQVGAVGQALSGHGIGRGDRVAMVFEGGPEAVTAFLGVTAHATCAPLDPASTRVECERDLAELRARALLVPRGSGGAAREAATALGIQVIGAQVEDGPSGSVKVASPAQGEPRAATEPGHEALILHSSGTTGRAHGVLWEHGALVASARRTARWLDLGPEDRSLVVMPLHHLSGLVVSVLAPLSAGGSVACPPPFQAAAFFEWLDVLEPTWYTASPAFQQAIVARASAHAAILKRRQLRFVRSSASPLPNALRDELEQRFGAPVIEAYSMTEVAPLSSQPLPPRVRKAGSVGLPLVELRIRDGEVVVRGEGTRPNRAEPAALESVEDGWLRTGDLGYLDADGHLFITGRLKELIDKGGAKIVPREVDEALLAHPAVSEAAAFGIPDPRVGQEVASAVVLRTGAAATELELQEFVASRLAPFKIPRRIVVVETLPRGATGKPDRSALAARFSERTAAEPEADRNAPEPAAEEVEAVTRLFAAVLSLPRVGAADDFFALGGDSMLAGVLLARLHDELARTASLPAFLREPTPTGLARAAVPVAPQEKPAAELRHAAAARFEPFPLTEVQQAYWVGRGGGFELGNVACRGYFEVEAGPVDLARMEKAFERLIQRHDMLRAVIDADGRQRVLEAAPQWRMPVLDLTASDAAAAEAGLLAVRDELIRTVQPSDRWPLYEARATRLPGGRLRLHFSFEALVFDAWSRLLVLHEWRRVYADPDAPLPPLGITFRDYVLAEERLRGNADERRSEAYWRARLDTLPAGPALPLRTSPGSIGQSRFATWPRRTSAADWRRLRERARKAGLSPSGVLLAAFADVLRHWSSQDRFSINLTLFNRRSVHADVNAVIGDFTSLTMLEVQGAPGASFEARARALQAQLWRDLDHRHFGGVRVLRERARRLGPGTPAMPVVFTSQLGLDPSGESPDPWGWLGSMVHSVLQTPQVWLDLGVAEEAGELVSTWSFVPELFPDGVMADMLDAYAGHLERLARSDAAWQAPWPETATALLPAPQAQRRQDYNATAAPIPEQRLECPFQDQAHARPDAIALVTTSRQWSYADVERESAFLARDLVARGAGADKLVAVVMEKGWEQLVATLGILRAGAAYLPIDPALPAERIHHLLKDGQVRIVTTQPRWNEGLRWPDALERVVVDAAGVPGEAPPAVADAATLAYVIYTSGSSGVPKGVAIEHRAAANTLADINRRFGVGPQDRVLALSALGFDLSVYDFFGTLAAGARIVLPDASAARDPSRWARSVLDTGVTIWNSVPALAQLYAEYVEGHAELKPRTLRLFLLSGDWIPVDLPDRLRRIAPGAQVVSLGGATEASVWSILYPIDRVDPAWESVPYGRPMANQAFHVLDAELSIRPEHVPGDLFIGGRGLARGYWGDAEKTAAQFFEHPRSGERLYRTGDRGRFLPSGVIEFLGRDDLQVKVQGHRIELAEIDAALARHPALRASAAGSIGPRNLRRLVAWIVPAEEPGPDDAALRAYLNERLPEAMVPSAFVRLPRLPLTANGKVDRGALPEPHAPATQGTAQGSGAVERMAGLVSKILPIQGLSAESNLLDLGATSVDLIRLANLLERELGRRPSIDVLYRAPVVREIARLFDDVAPAAAPAAARPSATRVIVDPEEREAFKRRRPGLRAEVGLPDVAIASVNGSPAPRPEAERRTQRRFSLKPVPWTHLSALLGRLSEESHVSGPRRLYASAGSIYAVQVYLWAKPGRVEGLGPGAFYFDPVGRRLVEQSAQATVDRDLYGPFVNRPIFDEAAFAVYLVADLGALEPLYGDRGFHYAALEAGAMCQLLETSGAQWAIGLCQIGDLEFDPLRRLFRLGETQVLVHSLLGGSVDDRPAADLAAASVADREQERRARLLEQIRSLSPDEVRALLEAERSAGKRE